ncbi:MAG: DUF4465 domain-containing protein [Prevotellaceae bacterium]|jgi:hypothetical protein|nr:DUF4465 domain-containing protein [Prevotellaceae bacterium]
MKTTNKFSNWCKITLMTLPALVMMTLVACEKDSAVAITGISLDIAALELTPGDTAALAATVSPGDATNKALTWQSSSTAIATVNEKGVVTAVSAGTATVTVTALDGGQTAACAVTVFYLIDFENVPATYLAGPTAKGANLYNSYTGTSPARYTGYDDAGSGLSMMVNESVWTGEIDFYGGGIAISQWNDMQTAGYDNQCSVYYSDAATHKGGYKGSNTFALASGYNEPVMMGDARSTISFRNEEKGTNKECVFNHFYVTNSTYAALSMKNGDAVAKQFGSGDWFKLVIEGFNKTGTSTGTVEFYLADFRETSSPGVITEWTKVDLTPLGSVAAIKFDLQSSDNGSYGMNTPAYFCFDNLAVKL